MKADESVLKEITTKESGIFCHLIFLKMLHGIQFPFLKNAASMIIAHWTRMGKFAYGYIQMGKDLII